MKVRGEHTKKVKSHLWSLSFFFNEAKLKQQLVEFSEGDISHGKSLTFLPKISSSSPKA